MLETETIRQAFQRRGIKLSIDWLEQCLEWIQSEHGNLSAKETEDIVYDEWLKLDFCDVQEQILPANINKAVKVTLNEKLHLQLQYVVDISLPKYQQLQKLRNANKDHIEEAKSDRVLELVLTDGLQEISAIEHEHIRALNVNLTAGIKVCLNPPITIRMGQIWLVPATITICGGDVDNLAVTNCQENILAKALGLPINENLNLQHRERNIADDVAENSNVLQSNEKDNDEAEMLKLLENLEGEFDEQPNNCNAERDKSTKKCLAVDENKQKKTIVAKRVEANEEWENFNFEMLEEQEEEDFFPGDLVQTSTSAGISNREGSEEVKSNVSVARKPVLSIERLCELKPNVHKGNFIIRAQFDNVAEKLSLRANCSGDLEYKLKIGVKDDTGKLEVFVLPSLIERLIEISASLFQSSNFSKEHTLSILEKFRNKLLNLNGEMTIQIEAKKEPVLIKIL